MEQKSRDEIRERVRSLVDRLGSQRKAANQLAVGTTTVGDIVRGDKDDQISEAMWRKIDAQMNQKSSGWVEVQTNTFTEVTAVISDAQKNANCTWIVAEAGSGKSTTARIYAEQSSEAVYVLCSEDMKRGDFLEACLKALGEKSFASSLRDKLEKLIDVLRNKKSPVLILDEADKLIDSILLYCVTIYNHLEGHCGIVMMSTNYIEKRMRLGLTNNKRGYNEIHSRIGRRFYEVDKTSAADVYGICIANGISDKSLIKKVIKEAEDFDFDLRRVKKCVLKYRA